MIFHSLVAEALLGGRSLSGRGVHGVFLGGFGVVVRRRDVFAVLEGGGRAVVVVRGFEALEERRLGKQGLVVDVGRLEGVGERDAADGRVLVVSRGLARRGAGEGREWRELAAGFFGEEEVFQFLH